MDYEKKDIIRESKQLYGDINSCITDLVNARIAKDPYNEGRAIFKMEGLMVATMQHLGCVIDFLEEQKEKIPQDEKVSESEVKDPFDDVMFQEGYKAGKNDAKKDYKKGYDDGYKAAMDSMCFHYDNYPLYQPNCFYGGTCINPMKDCINCPRRFKDFNTQTSSDSSNLKAKQ